MYFICRHFLSVACSGPNYHYSVIFSFHVANIYTLQFSSLHDDFSEIFTAFNYFAETPLLTKAQKKEGEAADSEITEIRCKWRAGSGGQELNIFSGNYVNIFMMWVY